MIEHTDINGDKRWYFNGELHRQDGPAIEGCDGNNYWYLNGKLHREDGPAIEWADGDRFWYLDGEYISEKEHKKAVTQTKAPCDGREVEIDGVVYVLKLKGEAI